MDKQLSHHRYRSNIKTGSLALVLFVAMGGGHAYGQSNADDNWQYEVMPYLWATAMNGNVQAGQLPRTSVDMKFSDIVDVLDFGFMTAFEARKGRWGFLFDGMYMKVSDSATASRADIGLSVDAKMQLKQSMVAAAVAYRAIEGNTPVDVIGGARYNKIDAEAKIDAGLFGGVVGTTVKKSGQKHWTDPYIGIRATMPINERWKGIGYIDVGGGSSGSDLTWQGMAGLIYTYSPSVTINMGYRYMKVDYDDGGFKYDMANDGLYAGIGFRF